MARFSCDGRGHVNSITDPPGRTVQDAGDASNRVDVCGTLGAPGEVGASQGVTCSLSKRGRP